MIDRRGFIKGLLGAIGAAATLDPDELLWVPGAKIISIPAIVAPSRLRIDGLTQREKYLCAAMGISEAGFMLRRQRLHAQNELPPGYFRTERPAFFGSRIQGAKSDDAVVFFEKEFIR